MFEMLIHRARAHAQNISYVAIGLRLLQPGRHIHFTRDRVVVGDAAGGWRMALRLEFLPAIGD
jgi:hypothetical protein